MEVKTFLKLYKKNSAGTKVLWWIVDICEMKDIDGSTIAKQLTTTGDLSGGKEKISEKIIKANAQKEAFERACALASTQWEKKVRLGYYETEQEARDSTPLRTAMLASTLAPEDIMSIPQGRFPLYMQLKLNGLRSTYHVDVDKLKSRELKDYEKLLGLQEDLNVLSQKIKHPYLDFELFDPDGGPINKQVSLVRNGADSINAYIFDIPTTLSSSYRERLTWMAHANEVNTSGRIKFVSTHVAKEPADVQKFYDYALSIDAEGIILRDPDEPYGWDNKNSRGIALVKVKPLLAAEFNIVGVGCEERVIDGDKVRLIEFLCETEGGERFKVTPANFGVELRKKMWNEYKPGLKPSYVDLLPPLSLEFREWTAKGKPFHIKHCYLRDQL